MQSIQLISRIDNNKWWKNLFIHYASKGEAFEIRCWDEETESIELIKKFGIVQKSKTTKEIIITGYITNEFIDLIVKEEIPMDQNIYNKMTQFFTINIDKAFSSCHYGTEIYIDEDEEFAKKILDEVKEYWT
ncbi:MAG: hypothetical protein J6C46_02150 [Clostridia bacterium]|nr:hypothetical protein [Clostridia bacterium]